MPPQLENGYTRIANELLEVIPQLGLPASARAVLDHVIRETYGRPGAPKFALFTTATVALAKGLNQSTVRRDILLLLEAEILESRPPPRQGRGKGLRVLSVQKDYRRWHWASGRSSKFVRAGSRKAPRARQLQMAFTLDGPVPHPNGPSKSNLIAMDGPSQRTLIAMDGPSQSASITMDGPSQSFPKSEPSSTCDSANTYIEKPSPSNYPERAPPAGGTGTIPNPELQTFVREWFDDYREAVGQDPIFDRVKHVALARQRLLQIGLEEIRLLRAEYFRQVKARIPYFEGPALGHFLQSVTLEKLRGLVHLGPVHANAQDEKLRRFMAIAEDGHA